MGIYMNDNNYTGFRYESGAYGTSGAGGLQWPGAVTDNEIAENENFTQLRYQGTGTRNVDKQVEGAIDITGTMNYHPQDWKMLAFALGSNVDSGSPAPSLHAMREIPSNEGNYATSGIIFNSFQIEDAKIGSAGTNFIRTVKGCMVDKFEITAAQGDIVEATVEYIGQLPTFTSGGESSITEAGSRPFIFSDLTLSLPQGTAQDTLKDITFGLSNNLDPGHYLDGNRYIAYPNVGNRDYNLDLTLDMTYAEALTMYGLYKSGTTMNGTITIADPGAGTGSRDCAIFMSGCKILEMPIPGEAEGVQEYSLTVQPESCSADITDGILKYNAW